VSAYDQVAAYNTAAQAYDAKLAAAQNPGPRPAESGSVSDPGAGMRERAQQILAAGRVQPCRIPAAHPVGHDTLAPQRCLKPTAVPRPVRR
jgi:hypothetical protein